MNINPNHCCSKSNRLYLIKMTDFNKFTTISQWCLDGIRLGFLFILASMGKISA